MIQIIWGEPKRRANLAKHGLDFADLDNSYFDAAVVRPARDPRWFAFGSFGGAIIAVVFRPGSRSHRHNFHAARSTGRKETL